MKNAQKFLILLSMCLIAAFEADAADYTEAECNALKDDLPTNATAGDVIAALEEGADGACYGKVLCRDADLCKRIAAVEEKAPDVDADEEVRLRSVQAQRKEVPDLFAAIRSLANDVVSDFPERFPPVKGASMQRFAAARPSSSTGGAHRAFEQGARQYV